VFKKALPAVVIASAIGLGAYTFWPKSHDGVPDQLYRFYPANTEFFLEVAPGNKLSGRVYKVLEDKFNVTVTTAPTPGKPGAPNAAATDTPGQLLSQFEQTFKPYFSLGTWQPTTTAANPLEPNTLVVLPLKEKLTFEALNARFNRKADEFVPKTFGKHTYYENKANHAAMAIVENLVLLANRPPVMETALGQLDAPDKTTNVYEEALNKTTLGKLPGQRQGTWLVHKPKNSDGALSQAGAVPAPLLNKLKQLQSVNPITVGAIHIEGDQWIETTFLSPYFLNDIPDPKLREQLKAIYSTNVALKAPSVLPEDVAMAVDVYGINRIYHLYADFFALPNEKQRLAGMTQFLKSFNIDFDQDAMGLLSEEATLGISSGQNMPFLVLSGKPERMASLQKMANVVTSGFFPIKLQSHQEGSTTINTLAMQGPQAAMAPQVSFATLPKSFIGLAPTGVLMEVLSTAEGKSKNLAANPQFKELTHGFPATGNGLFYLNMEQATTMAQSTGNAAVKEFITAIAVMTAPDGDMLKGQVRIKLTASKAK
jgi:hypothetical protein